MIQPLELMLWMDSGVHSSSPGPDELTAMLGLCGVPLFQGLQAVPLLAECSRGWTTGHYRPLSRCSQTQEQTSHLGTLFKIQILTPQA